MKLSQSLEAILFLIGEPVNLDRLSKITGRSKEDIKEALEELDTTLIGRGIILLKKNDSFMLGTSPEAGGMAKSLLNDEFSSDLSKAALETLSIIVYKSPISKVDIDYIRGVNSGFTVRRLIIRGLIERKTNPKDARSFIYSPSFDFLRFMGIKDINDVPEYNILRDNIDKFIEQGSKEEEV